MSAMHRRKSSRDEDEAVVSFPAVSSSSSFNSIPSTNGVHPNGVSSNGTDPPTAPRIRVHSTPSQPPAGAAAPQIAASHSYGYAPPPSAGPYQNGFGFPSSSSPPPPSPLRPSISGPSLASHHSRTRSTSGGVYAPSVSSPLSPTFTGRRPFTPPVVPGTAPPSVTTFAQASALPPASDPESQQVLPNAAQHAHARRHSRLHSRNLSIFFPRPGSLPTTTIDEDGAQELEVGSGQYQEAPVTLISTSASTPEPLGAGFRFGGRPPPSASLNGSFSSSDNTDEASGEGGTPTTRAARRGHHHKHSLSHNFFSFLEPGVNGANKSPSASELHTQPTPIPVSPWTPISPFPTSASAPPGSASLSTTTKPGGFAAMQANGGMHGTEGFGSSAGRDGPFPEISTGAVVVTALEFVLGAWVWVAGQQNGSLSVTGLGYWVVFDAVGVALARVVPGYLARGARSGKMRMHRPYGNARVETLFLFAQSVFLIFAAVYVCKETVEHLLLSAGEGEGHHHHAGDESVGITGIAFPVKLVFAALLSLAGTSLGYNNHSKLVNTAGNRLPPLSDLLQSFRPRQFRPPPDPQLHEPSTAFGRLLSNPYTLSPAAFSLAVLFCVSFLTPHQHRPFDLLLAFVEAAVTFSAAYPAAVSLGAVLLQTAPPRGLPDGRMELFLRTMRELERHPHVLHLPAPHIWQLTAGNSAKLVVTLELHVKKALSDTDVLELTKFAEERCLRALGGSGKGGERMKGGGAEVTVGVVRG